MRRRGLERAFRRRSRSARPARSREQQTRWECEYRDTTDPAVIKLILNVKPGMSEGYEWVTCNNCETSWAVPHYAKSSW
jgi:hypothetical protein